VARGTKPRVHSPFLKRNPQFHTVALFVGIKRGRENKKKKHTSVLPEWLATRTTGGGGRLCRGDMTEGLKVNCAELTI